MLLRCHQIYEPRLVNFGTFSKWPFLEGNFFKILMLTLVYGYVDDTNNALIYSSNHWCTLFERAAVPTGTIYQHHTFKIPRTWGVAHWIEINCLSYNPALCDTALGMVSKMRGPSWVIWHLWKDICQKSVKKWGIRCLKLLIFTLQYQPKCPFFALWLCRTDFFFDGVQIGSLKRLFWGGVKFTSRGS
jgi:hypothetical protein